LSKRGASLMRMPTGTSRLGEGVLLRRSVPATREWSRSAIVGRPNSRIGTDRSPRGFPGSHDAPIRARRSVRSQLEGHIPATTASDAALLVSELMTNSVVHANVGARRALTVDVTMLDDRLRTAVTDPRLTPDTLHAPT
jgi:hypothetical protein